MESEYITLDLAGDEAEWLKNFLAEIPLRKTVTFLCQCIMIEIKHLGKNRHICLLHNMVKQLLKDGIIFNNYVKSKGTWPIL